MITKEQALVVDEFHSQFSNRCHNWRRNGKTKTWKRQPTRFQIPVKYGLYRYGYLIDGVDQYHPAAECPFV